MPARAKFGPNQAAISLRWPDGYVQARDVFWTVEPRIRLAPPVVVLKPAPGSTEVLVEVRSADRPFGITRVSGPLLAGDGPTSPRSATTHALRLTLDPTRSTPGVQPEVEIATDDPDQPLLKLGVLIAPRSEAMP